MVMYVFCLEPLDAGHPEAGRNVNVPRSTFAELVFGWLCFVNVCTCERPQVSLSVIYCEMFQITLQKEIYIHTWAKCICGRVLRVVYVVCVYNAVAAGYAVLCIHIERGGGERDRDVM